MSFSTEVLNRFEKHVIGKGLIKSGSKLILGISGGADSTALVYLFSRLRYQYKLSLLGVHINHQLRAEASDEDEKSVKTFCIGLNIPLIIRKIELGAGADLENRARIARFEVFEQILNNYRFDKILLGHHKWDQAETVLQHLIRGSGLGGLCGIKTMQGKILHPLLIFSPEELRSFLEAQNIGWREDGSNFESTFTRNRIRLDLIPHIEQNFNPQFKNKLVEEAAIIEEAEAYICERALRKFKKIQLDASKERIFMSLPDLFKAPNIEQFYILRYAYQAISGCEQDFLSGHFQEIKTIMEAQGSKYITLPHAVYVRKQYQELIFSNQIGDIQPNPAEELSIEADRSRVVHMDYRFNFKYLKVLPADYKKLDPLQVIVDPDKLNGNIRIRSRISGDRFIPLGMSGLKKVKDFFIDEKVAKYDRDLIPIFCDEEKLFWICGYRMDDRVRVDEKSSRYLMITAEALTKKPKRAASRIKRGYDEFDEL